MNRLSIFTVFALCSVASQAQGTIDFMNRNIPGANGAASYNNPIWAYGQVGIGAGTLPGGVTVGLFEVNGTIPLVTTQLRTDTPANAQFFATSTQTATTSFPPGSTPQLIVRAWQTTYGTGLAGFNAAKSGGQGQFEEWQFIAQPLGGTPPGGGLPVPMPGMTGWGPSERGGYNCACCLSLSLQRSGLEFSVLARFS